MDIRVEPLKFGVIVMKDHQQIDGSATQMIRERRYIDLGRIKDAYTFRPILQARISVSGIGSTANLVLVTKFEYNKGRQLVWTGFQPQEFEYESTFYPDIVLNLERFRSGDAMACVWEIKAFVTVLTKEGLGRIPRPRERVSNQLARLPYQFIASFEWEVVVSTDRRFTPTGELRNPRGRGEERSLATLRADEI